MATAEKTPVKHIFKHGNSMSVLIPRVVLERLGWNRYDAVSWQVVNGSAVLTKVRIPTVSELRVAANDGVKA